MALPDAVRRMRFLRHFVVHVFCAFVCIAAAAPAGAQLLPNLAKATPGTAVFGLRQEGIFVTAPVTVDGSPVFRIAAPSAPSSGELPIDVRLLFVQNAISQILASRAGHGTEYDPQSLKIAVDRVGAQQTLVATDATHSNEVPILTITSADAQYASLPAELLAQQWQPQLQKVLRAALLKRQPAVIRSNLDRLTRIGIALLAATALAGIIWMFLNRRIVALKRRIEGRKEQSDREGASPENAHATASTQRRRVLALALREAGPDQSLQRARALAGFIVWLFVLVWASAVTWALLLFPQTTEAGQLILRTAARVALIWIVAGVVDKLADVIIIRFADAYAQRGASSENRARHLLRAPTISRAVGGFKRFVVVFIATLTTLSALSIPIASVVTIGGVAALAIGFAAQSLVRDLLNGLLVLFEDQYVVGDYVMIGDYNGIVENLTLRIAQIRDGRGHLITIPHSSVSQVVNASRNWSRVNFRIPVAENADLAKAIATLRETIEGLASERDWRDAIVHPVEWIGVESPSKNGVVLRASIRTQPLRQFDVGRIVNQRVYEAFGREGIALGTDPLAVPVPSVTASPDPL